MFPLFHFQKSHSITFPSLLSCGPAVDAALVEQQGNKSVLCVLECWAMGGGKDGWLYLLSLPHHVPHYLQMPSPIQLHPFNPAQHTPTRTHEPIVTKNGVRSQSLLQCDWRQWTLQRKSERKGEMRDRRWNKSIEKESWEHRLWTFLKSKKKFLLCSFL